MPEVWLRPQLLKSLVIVIRAHVMKVYASTLIIYKVNIFKVNIFTFTYYLFSVKKYDKVIQRIHLFWWRIPKVFINYAWTVFLKKQRVMRHPFFLFWQMWNEKPAPPPTFLCWRQLFTLPLYTCMKQIFLTKEDIPLHIWFFKLLYSEVKITLVCFYTQTHRCAWGIQGVKTPALFLYSRNCALNFNQFKRNTLKNQFKKQKNPSKQCTNSILLKFFNATSRRVLMNVE